MPTVDVNLPTTKDNGVRQCAPHSTVDACQVNACSIRAGRSSWSMNMVPGCPLDQDGCCIPPPLYLHQFCTPSLMNGHARAHTNTGMMHTQRHIPHTHSMTQAVNFLPHSTYLDDPLNDAEELLHHSVITLNRVLHEHREGQKRHG